VELDESGHSGDNDEEEEDWNRAVFHTQTFARDAAMSALVLAIRCGLQTVATSESPIIPLNGEGASGSCAKINKTGMVYTNIPESIKFDYYDSPGPGTKICIC